MTIYSPCTVRLMPILCTGIFNHDHQPALILLGEDCIEGALEVMIFVKSLLVLGSQPSTLNAPV